MSEDTTTWRCNNMLAKKVASNERAKSMMRVEANRRLAVAEDFEGGIIIIFEDAAAACDDDGR